MFARLGKGTLHGSLLECPWHGAQFDVTDGCVAKWVQTPGLLKLTYEATLPAIMRRGLPTYAVKEENGEVLVAVD
jgi:nitrite reductase/ring-hydroxylating ferredoxin subunit